MQSFTSYNIFRIAEIFSSGGENASPAEIEMGKHYGFEWPHAVEWYQRASVEIVLDRFVYIRPVDFRPDTAGEPFDKILTALRGEGLLDGNFYGEQIGTILADITCTAPNEAVAQEIIRKYLDWDHFSRAEDRHLHFYDWTFSEIDLPKFLDYLKSIGCVDIQYRLYQASNPTGKTPTIKDLDVMLQILESAPAWDIEKLADALGEIGDPRAAEPLIRVLERPESSEDIEFRDTLPRSLGRSSNPRSLEQIRIAHALGQIGDPQAVDSLIRLLEDRDVISPASAAAEALVRIGDLRAIEPLLRQLGDDDFWQIAVSSLGKFGEAARTPLNEALQDPAAKVRERAAQALSRVNDTRDFGASLAELRDNQPTVRYRALQKHLAERNADILIAYAKNPVDDQYEMFEEVLKALGEIGDPGAILPLREMIPTRPTDHTLIQTLVKLGAPPVEELLALYQNQQNDNWVRQSAIHELSKLRDPRTLDLFIEALSSTDHVILSAAIDGLSQIADQRAIEPLMEVFRRNIGQGQPTRMGQLVLTLRKLRGGQPIIRYLAAQLATENRATQSEIIWILRLFDKQGVDVLIAALSNNQIADEIGRALFGMGQQVREQLASAQNTSDPNIAGHLAEILKRIDEAASKTNN